MAELAELKDRIRKEMPELVISKYGLLDTKGDALGRAARFETVAKSHRSSEDDPGLASLPEILPLPKAYEDDLAEVLKTIGCQEEGAPYVIRGLTRSLHRRFSEDRSKLDEIAALFLDETTCPGAHGLPEADKSELRKIGTRPAPSTPPTFLSPPVQYLPSPMP